ncbi:MAG: VWA domain-containing protein [Thermoanaerobaculia bacterium]
MSRSTPIAVLPPRPRRPPTGTERGPERTTGRPVRPTVRHRGTAVLLAVLLLAGAVPASAAGSEEDLPEEYRKWLESVELLITEEEREAFLELEADYQRDSFIQRFWRVRDPDPSTARNELQDQWEILAEKVEEEFEGDLDERGRMLLLNGPPTEVIESKCSNLHPIVAWYYARSWAVGHELVLVFYRRHGAGPYRLFRPDQGLEALTDQWLGGRTSLQDIALSCPNGRQLAAAIGWVLQQGSLGFDSLVAQMEQGHEEPSGEWVATFDAYSTQVPESAEVFEADLELSYPGRHQSRTLVQGLISVPVSEVGTAELAGNRSHNFILNGEVLKDGELFETFRYKFDFTVSQVRGERIPLVFERPLRPAEYTLMLKVEDLNSGRYFRAERPVTVPERDAPPPPPEPDDPESARLLAEANAVLAEGESTLQLVQPRGELLTRMVRFDTLVTGEIEEVAFALNGRTILTDGRPPFTVELDLGDLPRTHSLRATGFDAEDREVASDEILINSGGTRFRVWITEPRKGRTYQDSFRARLKVEVPSGQEVDRVELFLDETPVATLYDEPWVQPVVLPEELRGEMAYLRAVAYLEDGNSTEDTVFINAPPYMEEVDVQFVELYATVLDRSGRPVQDLGEDDFQVFEEGEEQQILRFEQVRDRPIHAGILLDVSASMGEGERLVPARDAALQFYEQIVRPKDRAALVTFNDRPHLAVEFTNEVESLAGALAGLKAERGTALYDSLIFSLYYFNGIKGQKALLVLSDGKDESSRFEFDDALEYARRAGVTIYAVGLDLPRGDPRKELTRLAEETGGRSFFVDTPDSLPSIYAQVEEELRSQYLVAYQSNSTDTSGDFREVDLQVLERGLDVKTMTGYYP